ARARSPSCTRSGRAATRSWSRSPPVTGAEPWSGWVRSASPCRTDAVMDDGAAGGVTDESMPGMLRWQARHRPDAVAVICGDQRRTYAELNARSERIAAGLLARGLARGDRVAGLLANRVEYLEIYQAAARSGLALVPVNPALTGPEIEYILADSGATLLICGAGLV